MRKLQKEAAVFAIAFVFALAIGGAASAAPCHGQTFQVKKCWNDDKNCWKNDPNGDNQWNCNCRHKLKKQCEKDPKWYPRHKKHHRHHHHHHGHYYGGR